MQRTPGRPSGQRAGGVGVIQSPRLRHGETVKNKPPVAWVEYEVKSASGVKRKHRKLGKGDNLHELSDGLDQYEGFVVSNIDARIDQLSFTNGVELTAGEVTVDVTEKALRQVQIRESVKALFKKEPLLFSQRGNVFVSGGAILGSIRGGGAAFGLNPILKTALNGDFVLEDKLSWFILLSEDGI